MLRPLVICWLLFGLALPRPAANELPQPDNTEPLSAETQMSGAEAAETMRLPDGFTASLFASEPDVQNPIAMAWDGRGRLWVAENYTYGSAAAKFRLDLRDRVVIFDGTDRDRFQQRIVFTDNVQMLTGIAVGHGGVWLMCPPKLIFIPDRDADDVPDSDGEVVLDGFTVAKQNYHNFANGLKFGPDGWLYGRCGGSCPGRIGVPGTADHQRRSLEGGLWRYHPHSKSVEVLTSGTTNPWGHDWNTVGECFFVNTVNGHLWHGIAGAHFTRPFTLDPNPRTYELIDFHADHWHFDTGKSWIASRNGKADAYGGGHAHQGAMIYQGTVWPAAYRDKLFTFNLHGRRANCERLERRGSGYVGRHEPDLMIAADPWFRGMDLSPGPDGNVFVIDWSDTGECHEHTGVHRTSGRVFKIRSQGSTEATAAIMPLVPVGDLSLDRLAELALSPDAWSFRQARLELARRRFANQDLQSIAPKLISQWSGGPTSAAQAVRALLALHAAGQTHQSLLRRLLNHNEAHVRVWAIRLLTEGWPIDDALGPVDVSAEIASRRRAEVAELLPEFQRLASADPSALVRLNLASILQRLPVTQRVALATPLAARGEDAGDHNLPLMIWYGLMAVDDRNLEQLISVAEQCALPTTLRLISRRLAEAVEMNPKALNRLVEVAADCDDPNRQATMIDGISQGWYGWRKVKRPHAWNQLVSRTRNRVAKQQLDRLGVLFGDGRSMEKITDIALGDTEADYPIRLEALRTLIQADAENLKTVCQKLLGNPRLNVLAAQGLAKFDDPAIARSLVSRYRSFRAPTRPQLMSILVSRTSFATAMLQAVGKGKIPRDDLSPFQIRQLKSLNDAEVNELISDVWGRSRVPSASQQDVIDRWKHVLNTQDDSSVDLSNGRALFAKHCQSCHRLYGVGQPVGPDLTGGNRDNLDYLLSNIVAPSAVVDRDFRMTKILTVDGRLITGLVTSESDRTVAIRTATESMILDKSRIESTTITETSPMPDGIFESMSEQQVRDLVGYLRHPTQVDLPE